MVDERSAGAVLFIHHPSGNQEPEYLLLNYAAGHWDFPKGNIELGETEHEAAVREIQEETGITDVEFIDGFEQSMTYRYRKGKRLIEKEVVLFLAKTNTRKVTISHEHIGYAWKKYDDATRLLTYRNARDLLAAALDYARLR